MSKHNYSIGFLLLTNCYILSICTNLSSGVTEFKFCRSKIQTNIASLTVTCFKHIANDSSLTNKTDGAACGSGNLTEFQELTDEDLFSAMHIVLRDCSLKPGMFGSRNLPRLRGFDSSPSTQNVILQNNSFIGLCSLKVIVLRNNSIEAIRPSAFSCLTSAVRLDLSYNKLESLTNEIFEEMESLSILNLSNNRLHTLSEGVLYNLIYLNTLSLYENYIMSLPDKLFGNLRRLEYLILSSNKIEVLNEHIFSNLTELARLELIGNKVKSLTNVFSRNKNLVELLISQNGELVLTEQSLRGLSNLNTLAANKCKITSLPEGLFQSTPELVSLYLNYNTLQEINGSTFASLRKLQKLALNFNQVSVLHGRPFKNNNLSHLGISNNKLSEIKKYSFQGLSSIIGLDISSNRISKIDGNAFENMPSLSQLYIGNNLLSSLQGSRPFGKGESLLRIDVSNNFLTDIRNIYWEEFSSLTFFNAINNRIEELSVPQYTRQHADLHFEFNNVKIINFDWEKNGTFFPFTKTTFIYLRENPIVCDCYAYKVYDNLKKGFITNIEFSDGLVCHSPKEFSGTPLTSLKPTDFFCNIVDMCPERCSCTYIAHDNRRITNCSNSALTYIPLESPYNTTMLDISHNNLTSLIGLNDKIWENLTEIYAQYNEITSDEFYLPHNVKLLYLHHNKLKRFPVAIKNHRGWKNDFKASISNNLWPCDCLIMSLKKHIKQVIDIKDVYCIFANHSVSNITVMELNEADICPMYEYAQYAGSFAVLILLVLIIVLYYKHKLYVLSFLYTYCNSCYVLLFCDRQPVENKLFDCFISYSSTDREVTLAILEELENKPPKYKFCIHERNWLPGEYIANNIIESVQNSRKTIIIISKTFLQSPWFYLEFQAAYHKSLEDKTDRLIIIIKGELPSDNELDSDVLYVITSKTYLEWGERWFWEKLRYAIYREKDLLDQKSSFCFTRLAFWCLKKKNLTKKDITFSTLTSEL